MAVDFFTIGQRIQKRRKMLRKTQEQMAEALSVSVGYVSQIERGVTKISLDTLSEITEYLDCNFSELLDGSVVQSNSYLNDEIKILKNKLSPVNKKILFEIADILEKNQSD
ncbi:helix-turn-helix transcriptional regulator [uncultured Treponema sp.]|uniref:helix-turn-helix domain-containing protein n=1 Tax=uncultured Treponema sp. TaxID=162155 RepID=UPI0026071494|nr:helix-turn-helix transcriptional regulator [uncultured Treponema sp.]